jgi:hypothetical protein
MPLLANCPKGGTHATTPREKNFRVDLKWTWKKNGLKLFTPIVSNKNRWKFNKNLEAMTKATKA